MIRLAQAATGVGAAACLGTAALAPPGPGGQAALMLGGFALLAVALALTRRVAGWVAAAFATAFAVFGGASAFAARADLRAQDAAASARLSPFVDLGLTAPPAPGLDPDMLSAFEWATRVTIASGLAVIVGALLGAVLLARRRPVGGGTATVPRAAALERWGRRLVLVGLSVIPVALARVALNSSGGTAFESVKAFWRGGSYLLLVAHVALPGFAFWFAALAARGARRAQWRLPVAALAVYLVALVPTGQRTFVFEAAVVAAAVLIGRRPPTGRQLLGGLAALLVLFTATQALRNELRETDSLTVLGALDRLAPNQLPNLFSSQVASFRWTVETHLYDDDLEIRDHALSLLVKPIPRQLYPGKPDGFSEQFTRALYPDAADQEVYFATPLVAESSAALTAGGAVVAHLLLGLLAGLAAIAVGRLPAIARPAAAVAAAWTAFVFLRGDAANALFIAAGWVVPVVAVLWLARRERPVRRVVVDALQVRPEISGVGRVVESIGRTLERDAPDLDIVLRAPADVAEQLRGAFGPGTAVETPLASSRPAWRRILHQQVVGPVRDRRDTLLVCPGDQGPLWGRARIVFCALDVRRLTHPQLAGRAERWLYRLLQPGAMRRADVVLTISRFSASAIEQAVAPPAAVRVVDLRVPRRASGARPAAPDAAPLLVTGALRPYKGADDVIRALGRLGSRAPRLLLAGETEGRDHELSELARDRGVLDRVELLGWIGDRQLAQLLGDALATVHASHFEGYGLALAESLAYGVPAIASRIPAHVEVAGSAPLWFEPGDDAGLAACLERVAADRDLRAELARAAYRQWETQPPPGPSWGRAIAELVLEVQERARLGQRQDRKREQDTHGDAQPWPQA